jgi:hypothetical protein
LGAAAARKVLHHFTTRPDRKLSRHAGGGPLAVHQIGLDRVARHALPFDGDQPEKLLLDEILDDPRARELKAARSVDALADADGDPGDNVEGSHAARGSAREMPCAIAAKSHLPPCRWNGRRY